MTMRIDALSSPLRISARGGPSGLLMLGVRRPSYVQSCAVTVSILSQGRSPVHLVDKRCKMRNGSSCLGGTQPDLLLGGGIGACARGNRTVLYILFSVVYSSACSPRLPVWRIDWLCGGWRLVVGGWRLALRLLLSISSLITLYIVLPRGKRQGHAALSSSCPPATVQPRRLCSRM